MSTKYPCYIEFSDSGRTARMVHKNGKTIAELLIHGPFAERTNNIHVHRCVCGHSSVSHAQTNGHRCIECNDCTQYTEAVHLPFQAEVYGLADWEHLDMESEILTERTKQ